MVTISANSHCGKKKVIMIFPITLDGSITISDKTSFLEKKMKAGSKHHS
jgi:hypothetical protein